jgi:hypothetical protein
LLACLLLPSPKKQHKQQHDLVRLHCNPSFRFAHSGFIVAAFPTDHDRR